MLNQTGVSFSEVYSHIGKRKAVSHASHAFIKLPDLDLWTVRREELKPRDFLLFFLNVGLFPSQEHLLLSVVGMALGDCVGLGEEENLKNGERNERGGENGQGAGVVRESFIRRFWPYYLIGAVCGLGAGLGAAILGSRAGRRP